MIEAGKLRYRITVKRNTNSADGYGYIPSWSRYSTSKLVRLISSAYIDHCLVSKSFNIKNKKYQYIKGSDHVLISTELGF